MGMLYRKLKLKTAKINRKNSIFIIALPEAKRYAILDFLVTENQIFELVHGLFTNKPPPLQCETACNS